MKKENGFLQEHTKTFLKNFGVKISYLRHCFSNEKIFKSKYRIYQAEMIDKTRKKDIKKEVKKERKKRKRKEYAIYKGEKFLGVGTAKELALEFGISDHTIRFMASEECRRRNKGNRKIAVVLNEED